MKFYTNHKFYNGNLVIDYEMIMLSLIYKSERNDVL